MKLSKIVKSTVKKGDNSTISFKDIPIIDSRLYSIPNICKGKKVLVIGCVDMTDVIDIDNRISSGDHQFHNISTKADYCLGIDINSNGVNLLSGLDYNVKYYDIMSDQTIPELNQQFDYVVVSHVLEHIVDLTGFIYKLANIVNCKEFIFAVPNAYNIKHALPALLLQREKVSNDHYYTFTPITLIKLLTDLGFHINNLYLDQDRKIRVGKTRRIFGTLWSIVKNKFFKHSGDLIAVASYKK